MPAARRSPFPTPLPASTVWCKHAGLKLSSSAVYVGTHVGVKGKGYYHFAKAMIWESEVACTSLDLGAIYVLSAIRKTIKYSGPRRRFRASKQARTIILKLVSQRQDKGLEWTPSERTQHEPGRAKRAILLWEVEMKTFPYIGSSARHVGAQGEAVAT